MFRSIRIPLASLLVLVAVGGLAFASRNSTGTYSLPTGNPVIPGTTISTSWANSTLSDISTEITNSLDRSGRGAMLAPLQHSSGTVNSPSLTFSSEVVSGIYRAGTNDLRMSVNQTDAQKWSPGASTFPGTLGVTGNTTLSGTLGVTGATTLSSTLGASGLVTASAGINATMPLPASGTMFPAADTFSIPVTPTTSGNNYPIAAFRSSIPTDTLGITIRHKNVTTASSWTNVALCETFDVDTSEGIGGAFCLSNGKFMFGGNPASPVFKIDTITGNPGATIAENNTLTAKNITKAWAHLSGTGIADGFNVASTSCGGNLLTITFASAMVSANYSATWSWVDTLGAASFLTENGRTASTITLQLRNASWVVQNICTLLFQLDLTVTGVQ